MTFLSCNKIETFRDTSIATFYSRLALYSYAVKLIMTSASDGWRRVVVKYLQSSQ